MTRKSISSSVERRLWADSLGLCGNPRCKKDLFREEKDIGEKSHVVPYCESQDNSSENLILLCPDCHTYIDKAGDEEELRRWKQLQQKEMNRLRKQKFTTFEELKTHVKPLLEENKDIYEAYYLNQEQSTLWIKFEEQVLVNNRKIQVALENNLGLFQGTAEFHRENNYKIAKRFILHAQEFEKTRGDDEKIREVLFPSEINSIFDVEPLHSDPVQSVSALQNFIKKLEATHKFIRLDLLSDPPFIEYLEKQEKQKLFLDDEPKVRQIYWDNDCYRSQDPDFRLESLLFFLRGLRNNGIDFAFVGGSDIVNITIGGRHNVRIVYEYCLSEHDVRSMSPPKGLLIVNLDYTGCISRDARKVSKSIGVRVFTLNEFLDYWHNELSK